MQNLPGPLQAMASYAQFILWKLVPDTPKAKKLPVNPHTLQAFSKDSNWQEDPSTWATFEVASAAAQLSGLNVGFFFTHRDPFFFVDIDGALVDGNWSPFAMEMCTAFQGCAIEVSQSGTGLHIFGRGVAPENHRCRDDKIGIEFYTEGRFVALTGSGVLGDANTHAQHGVDFVLSKYLPPRATPGSQDWTTEPVEDWSGPESDDELIAKMLKAKSSAAATFGTRASLKALWEGDADELAKFYPSSSGDAFDRSSADSALCQHLAFWAGKDCERVKRLFERSGLVRGKWFDREDYRHDTIVKSCNWCTSVYQSRKKPKVVAEYEGPVVEIPEGVVREGFQFLNLQQQLTHFKGCVYVARNHAIKLPNGELVKGDTFRALYGGYWFALDSIGDKSSKNAWEVFTESQGLRFPRVNATCFRPELPVNEVVNEEGRTLINTYVPIEVKRLAGDPSLFLNHMAKILPVNRDREILINYMAACVQMIGTKFRWCPFIQGVEGNGKTTLSEVVEYAIGYRYSHSPAASDLANKFNAWIEGRLFIYIEDVYVSDRGEVWETLKPLITNKKAEVQQKGNDKFMVDNRANFMLNSNHKDGVRKTLNDRRIAVFYTAQQTRDDLARDGMGDEYFKTLKNWLENEEGFAIVADYLSNYQINEEFNPANMSAAPLTGSTHEALAMGLGGVEQDILEAIAQGRSGFMGGWISSYALERLLEQRKDSRKLPHNKRKDILQALGFVPHPGLSDGRVTSMVAIEGGTKPRLYIKRGHLSSALTTNGAIVEAYVKAQEAGGVELAAEVFKRV